MGVAILHTVGREIKPYLSVYEAYLHLVLLKLDGSFNAFHQIWRVPLCYTVNNTQSFPPWLAMQPVGWSAGTDMVLNLGTGKSQIM